MDPIEKLSTEQIPIEIEHQGKVLKGVAQPLRSDCSEIKECVEMDITLNNEHLGTLYCGKDQHCTMRNISDQELVKKIADQVLMWME